MPEGFPFSEFRGVGAAIALPIRLTGTGPPVGNIQSIVSPFVGSSAFAFAVSREHVDALMATFLDSLKTAPSISVLGFEVSVTVTIHPLAWSNGKITVSGGVEFHNTGPNQWIDFSQALTLELDVAAQRVALVPAGEPSVDESFFISHSTAVNGVKRARDSALGAGAIPINNALRDAKRRINSALATFDPTMSASVTGVEITPHGVIVRGEITSTTARPAPIVEVREANHGQAFTALHSWIPGGRVQQFTWSWVEYGNASIWSGVTKVHTDRHQFIFPKPAGTTDLSNICLRITGLQTSPTGIDTFVTGGTFCQAFGSERVLEMPSWSESVTIPVWRPDSRPDEVVNDLIAGHINVQADKPLKNELSHNFLVHFVDWGRERPVATLQQALAQLRRRNFSLAVILVLPQGAFTSRRREVEARLDGLLDQPWPRVLLTEDHDGSWSRIFSASQTSSYHLMNARRDFVWSSEGELNAAELASALEKHVLAGPIPRAKPLRLAVRIGDPAPDVLFGDERGNHVRLRWLRGRPLLVNFWQDWSAPSLKELVRLQQLATERAHDAPFIIAFHGGKSRDAIDQTRRKLGLSFVLSRDDEQRVARIYGVRCWPTTVSINADGIIEQLQFGVLHDHLPPPADATVETY